MRRLFNAALLLSFVLPASNALAGAIIQFPFWTEGETIIEESQVFQQGGLSLTVTAWTSSYNSRGEQLLPWQQVTGDGLGVFRDEEGLSVLSSEDDGAYMDGGSSRNSATDPDEGLLFVFSETVNWFDVFFTHWNNESDDVNFSVVTQNDDGSITLGKSLIDIANEDDGYVGVYEFEQQFRSQAFMVWVDGNDDDIAIGGMAVVPTPATVSLAALLMFCGWRRRSAVM